MTAQIGRPDGRVVEQFDALGLVQMLNDVNQQRALVRMVENLVVVEHVAEVLAQQLRDHLLVHVRGRNLREVAQFVSEKLATIEGVISTATHFMLKAYKDQGVLMEGEDRNERLSVSP